MIINKLLQIKNLHLKFGVFYVFTSSLLTFPMADDGWYLIEAKVLKLTGSLIQYQYPVTFPVGYIHAILNSIPITFTNNFLFFRVIPSLICLSILYFIFQLRNKFKFDSQAFFIFSLWCLFSTSFFISFRAEIFIAFLFTILIYVTKKTKINLMYLNIPLILILNSLALSIHQSGIILPFATLPILVLIIIKKHFFKIFTPNFFIGLSVSLLIFFINSTPNILIQKIKNFQAVNNWPQPFPGEFKWGYLPWFEYKRLIHLTSSTPLQFISILILFVTLILIFVELVTNLKSKNIENSLINLIFLTAPFGLFLAPSKWTGHYAALLPIVLYFLSEHLKKLRIFLLFILFQLIFITSLALDWVPGGINSFNPKIKNIIDYTASILVIKLVICFIILTALILIFFKFHQTISRVFIVNSLVIFSFLLLQIAPPAIDSISKDKDWTFIRQLWNFRNYGDCGIFEEAQKLGIFKTEDKFVFTYESYSLFPCLNPILPKNGIWEYPNFSVGGIPIWDQQRLAYEVEITRVYCPVFTSREFLDEMDRCIYKWQSKIPQARLVSVENVKVW